MTLSDLLGVMVKRQASELVIAPGAPPSLKVDAGFKPLSRQLLSDQTARDLVFSAMNDEQRREYQRERECSFEVCRTVPERFRVSVYQQNGLPVMVIRRFPVRIPDMEALNLPPAVGTLICSSRGLILLASGSYSHRSEALAAMVDHRNQTCSGLVVTFENPKEYLHEHGKSIVAQREVGTDVVSVEQALSRIQQQVPDVVAVGEICTREIMDQGIRLADSGCLCLGTVCAGSTEQALERILSLYPGSDRSRILMDLSFSLKALVSRRPLYTDDGNSCVASEVMINTPLTRELIRKGEIHRIREVMKNARDTGMQTFDQSLFELYRRGAVGYEVAIRHADSVNDIRLMIKLKDDVRGQESGREAVVAGGSEARSRREAAGVLSGFTLLPDLPVESGALNRDSRPELQELDSFSILPDKSEGE